jgi:hypothetical protein
MSLDGQIISKAEQFVREYLNEHLPSRRLYHNFEHAREVADVSAQLANAAYLSHGQSMSLMLAAWFHDCGYANAPGDIAAGSILLLDVFLRDNPTEPEIIDGARELIKFIHSGAEPKTLVEELFFDANYSYIGRKRFFNRSELLRIENETFEGRKLPLFEWQSLLMDTLVNHRFRTPWAQARFTGRQNKNIVKQRELKNKAMIKSTRKRTGKDFGRGVDTLYRVTLRNHINLSRIADGKANMIISINTLVLSIIITAGAFGFSLDQLTLQESLTYLIPVIMLMLTALATIILAVFSALPKVAGENFDMEDVRQHKLSILFFGNFLQLSREQFVDHLRDLKRDQEVLYDDLSRDLYNLGAVLAKKYRLLSLSYKVFIIGLAISILTFFALYLI